jgi:hypothetical protein
MITLLLFILLQKVFAFIPFHIEYMHSVHVIDYGSIDRIKKDKMYKQIMSTTMHLLCHPNKKPEINIIDIYNNKNITKQEMNTFINNLKKEKNKEDTWDDGEVEWEI